VNSFTVVSVVYLDEHIGLSGTEIGIFFLATLIASLPGTKLGAWVTHRTNPSRSFRICMACLVFVTVVGAILVDTTVDAIAYLWAICIGILLGWFYPTQNLYFSMILPKGQEAEFSGFYVYCSQVLAWAPPLLFSALVTANISQTFGVVSVSFFLVIAIGILSCAASWPEILEESHQAADPEKGDSEIAQVEQQSTDS
jgi:MFS-type transporter involved in bile tolerance (Atg22 family)